VPVALDAPICVDPFHVPAGLQCQPDNAVLGVGRWESLGSTPPDQEWYDPEVGIRWQQAERWWDGQRVMLQFYDPFIHEGFRFSRAVPQKLNKQLKRARERGYPTLLILDQKPPDYVDWITNSAPEPPILGEMLAYLVASQRTTLNAGVLVNADDTVHEIYGCAGKPAN
jgi:hypothetical protein